MARQQRVLLLYPSCFNYPAWMERVEVKTSLVWLASYVSRFAAVEYVDLELEIGRPNSRIQYKRFERQVENLLSDSEYDILAISCWTSLSYQASLAVARIARRLHPDRLIVVGGYHPTARPQEFVTAEQLFDYVVTGEGELFLRELVTSPTDRPVRTTVVKGASIDADDFVPINWSLVSPLIEKHFDGHLDNMYLYLSRGCPFACSFCMEPLKDRRWRAIKPVAAVDQMFDAVSRFGAHAVALADACFGMRPSWRKPFLEELVARNPEFWIVLETRAEYLDDEDMDLLAQLKVEIQFGLESGSDRILRLMNKTRQPAKYLDCFEQVSRELSRRKILHRANMIFNHPGETEATLHQTFAFIDHMLTVPNSYLIWANHGYMHFPGCELDFNKERYEQDFNARFDCGDWWKADTDQYETSMMTEPTDDLAGARAAMWQSMLAERERAIRDSLALPAFKFAANKYYQNWKTDARYYQTTAVA